MSMRFWALRTVEKNVNDKRRLLEEKELCVNFQCNLFISKIAFVLLSPPRSLRVGERARFHVVGWGMNVSHNDGSCDKRWVINNDISGALLPALVEVDEKKEREKL